jgi:hypothetical protein
MNPWVPLPLAVATAPAYRALSLAAVGALAMLYLAAGGGAAVDVPDEDADRASTVLWGTEGPGILGALESAGFVTCDGSVWRLRHAVVLRPASATAAAPVAPIEADGDASGRIAHKRLAAHWSRRGLRAAEDRAAWHLTEAGGAILAALGLDLATADALAGRAGTRGGRFGLDRPASPVTRDTVRDSVTPRDTDDGVNGVNGVTRDTATVSTTVSRPVSPSHSPSEKEGDKEDKDTQNKPSDARASGTATVSRVLSLVPTHGVTGDAVTVSRCPTVETVGYSSAELLADLRTRAPRALTLGCDSVTEASVARVMLDLSARGTPEATPEGYRALCDWIAAGGLGWWTRGRPSVAYLAKPGTLATLLGDASAWARAGRPAITHGQGAAPGTTAFRKAPQDSARGIAPVSPPGSYARAPGAPDALERYLVQPLARTGTAG